MIYFYSELYLIGVYDLESYHVLYGNWIVRPIQMSKNYVDP